ncbi:MAG: protoporphyrinogen oxidase, partial [Rubricoccaceae bacterium]
PGAARRAAALGVAPAGPGGAARVLRRARLHPLPAGLTGLVPGRLGPLLRSPALPLGARLRAAAEPLVRARRADADESLEAFAVRRFGRGAWTGLIEPLLGGLYGADDGPISLRATLPHLHAAERAGPLLRLASGPGAAPAPGGSPFRRPVGGMQALTDALEAELVRLGVCIERDTAATRLADRGTCYIAETSTNALFEAEAVVVALPAPAAARLLAALDPAFAGPLGAVPMGSATAVVIGLPGASPEGLSGWLVPRAEAGAVQAVTVLSAKHPGAAPEGHVLARLFLRPGFAAQADDAAARAAAREHLARVLGLGAEPVFAAVHRWAGVLPRYTLGHPERLAALEAARARHPRLVLTGASLRGVGLPDVVADAEAAAGFLLPPSAPSA